MIFCYCRNQIASLFSYRSPSYMKRICPASCFDMGIPSRNECIDVHENCALWSQDAECETNNEVKRYCKLSCGSCANIGKKDFRRNDDTQERGRTLTTRTSTEQKDSCKNNHDSCSSWAVRIVICIFESFIWVVTIQLNITFPIDFQTRLLHF